MSSDRVLSFSEESRLRYVRDTLYNNPLRECDGVDTDVFYEGGLASLRKAASTYCGSCVLKDLCKEKALLENDYNGVQGGLTPGQLEKIIKEENRQRRECRVAS